jgi:hypothetical protein
MTLCRTTDDQQNVTQKKTGWVSVIEKRYKT